MAATMPPLTAIASLIPTHVRFIEEYVKDHNAARAALAAGLSQTYGSAAVIAHKLLKTDKIRAAVRYLKNQQARRLQTSTPHIVREWAILGLSDITNYTVDDDGNVDVKAGVPRSALRAVKKVKVTRTVRKDGRGEGADTLEEVRTELELHDKITPLTKLYEHFEGTAEEAAARELADALRTIVAARNADSGGTGEHPAAARQVHSSIPGGGELILNQPANPDE